MKINSSVAFFGFLTKFLYSIGTPKPKTPLFQYKNDENKVDYIFQKFCINHFSKKSYTNWIQNWPLVMLTQGSKRVHVLAQYYRLQPNFDALQSCCHDAPANLVFQSPVRKKSLRFEAKTSYEFDRNKKRSELSKKEQPNKQTPQEKNHENLNRSNICGFWANNLVIFS